MTYRGDEDGGSGLNSLSELRRLMTASALGAMAHGLQIIGLLLLLIEWARENEVANAKYQ